MSRVSAQGGARGLPGVPAAPVTSVVPARVEIERSAGALALHFPEGLAAMAATADGSMLALAHSWYDRRQAMNVAQLVLLEPETGRLRGPFAYRDDANCCGWPPVAVAPATGGVLLAAGALRAYRRDGTPLASWPFAAADEPAAALAISVDGSRAVAVTSQNRLYLLSGLTRLDVVRGAGTRPAVSSLSWPGSFDVALSADGSVLLVAGGGRAQLLSVDGDVLRVLEERSLPYSARWATAALSADGGRYATAGLVSGSTTVQVDLFARGEEAALASWTLEDVRLPRLMLGASAGEVVVDNTFGGGAAILRTEGRPSTIVYPAASEGTIEPLHVGRDGSGRMVWVRGRQVTLWPATNGEPEDGAAPLWETQARAAVQQILLAGRWLFALAAEGDDPQALTSALWAWRVDDRAGRAADG